MRAAARGEEALPAGAQDENNKGKTCPWQYHGQNMRQQGDHRPAFSPWEYMKAENEFVTRHAQLTVVEANYVCPLLHEMKDEVVKTEAKGKPNVYKMKG